MTFQCVPYNGRASGENRIFLWALVTELWRSEYRYAEALFLPQRFLAGRAAKTGCAEAGMSSSLSI